MPDDGRKDDQGKAQWDLVPWEAMEPVVRVLMHGAKKYGPHNWRLVDRWEERYWNAAMRHLLAYGTGHSLDEETGLPHLAHAMCCLLFLLGRDLEIPR